jgi:glycosyltransferase involved in cell wall biosynthesis
MRPPQLAAVVKGDRIDATTIGRLERVLEFLGIPYQVFDNESQLCTDVLNGNLRVQSYSILEPATALSEESSASIAATAHSRFIFLSDDIATCREKLRQLCQSQKAEVLSLSGEMTQVSVSKDHASLTGAMHGLKVPLTPSRHDYVLTLTGSGAVEKIIEGEKGLFFFATNHESLRTYVSCSSAIPDLKRSTNGRAFDVKEEFLSIVPLFTYLKSVFREICWQPNEHGACLIIDDPILRTNYGCCDFRQIDRLMKEHSFATTIAFIPWNWRRTSSEMSKLIRNSDGRFSISMHGCNHTGGEFGIADIDTLNATLGLARRRMDSHRDLNAVAYDRVMVFPQGVFSRESLSALQQQQFIAAVNTKVLPANGEPHELTVEDVCSAAIDKYYSFPLFTRRYPQHGLENFAFDLLLGKPCLIVEHHNFFADGGQSAVEFIDKVNSLNCPLRWRGLTEVLRRSFQWRRTPEGTRQIRMFANEMLVTNGASQNSFCQVEKRDSDSAGVTEVLINGAPAPWQRNNGTLNFSCSVPIDGKLDLRVSYQQPTQTSELNVSSKAAFKIATRRYLSEFRDNFLCRHERLMSLAQTAKRFIMPANGRNGSRLTDQAVTTNEAPRAHKTILLISTKVPHYRVSIYNYLRRRFHECGWEFKVASDSMQAQSELDVKFDFRKTPFSFANYRKLIEQLKPDVVMFHLRLKDWIFWPLIHWLRLKRTPIVCWTKGANLDAPDNKLRYNLFNYFHGLSDALVLYSKRQLVHIKPRNRGKVFVANNTVNFEDYPQVPDSKEEIKKELGIPFQKVALFVGTMGVDGDRKKAKHVIQVFRDLDRSDVGLVLAGGGMTDDLKGQLNPKNSMFLGQIHDPQNLRISKLFKAADLFVIPGHVGLGLNQAFYWGLPLITEAGKHPPEIQYLKSGSNGFMVKENDLEELKEKMLYLLDNDSVRAEFSTRAREDILREASIEGMFVSFRQAIDFVCPKKRHNHAGPLRTAPRTT